MFIHDVKYAGRTASDKIRTVLQQTAQQGAEALLVADLAETAWVLNIRSSDVSCTPVATAFLYLAPAGSTLFIKGEKINDEVQGYLAENGVTVAPYSSITGFLETLPESARVLIEPGRTASRLRDALGARAVSGASPVAMLKATKNSVQTDGIRRAMENDGAALVGAFMEIEERMAKGIPLTELDVADILTNTARSSPVISSRRLTPSPATAPTEPSCTTLPLRKAP